VSQHRPDPDDAFDRVRAADPAAGLQPDAASLDAAVRRRLGEPDERAAAAGADDLDRARGARTHATPTRAARLPGRWAAVAAVAAGTLVVGTAGGYALGSRDGGTGTTAAAGAISLSGSTGSAGAAESSALGEDAARAAADAPSVASDTAMSSSFLPWFGGRTVFSASGLSDEAGTAEAWAYDPSQVFGTETASRVASSLGLEGEPRLEGGTWVVGPQDGTSASLQLQPDGVTSVSYYDPRLDPFGCPRTLAVPETAVDGGGTEPGTVDPGIPPCEPAETGPAPQGEAAQARAREVLQAAGVDPDRYEYEVGDSGTPDAAYVTAFEVVDGQRSGLAWSVTLVGDGVQALYGGLAPLVPLGSYEVVSENEAVARLSDPRFGASGGGVMPAASSARAAEEAASAIAPAEPAPDGGMAPATPPATVAPGAALGWPVTEVELVAARLGLAQHTLPTGATVLLPAYELSSADGATWSVVAVADARLDFSSVG
jgi:hypothetical protein